MLPGTFHVVMRIRRGLVEFMAAIIAEGLERDIPPKRDEP
jgi:hypothetical protein